MAGDIAALDGMLDTFDAAYPGEGKAQRALLGNTPQR